MGDGVVDELVALFIFLWARTKISSQKKEKGERTDLCRDLTIEIKHPNENGRIHRWMERGN